MDALNSKLVHGIRLLRLTGNDAERAAIHAAEIRKLSADQQRKLALNPLSKKNQSLIRRAILNQDLIPEFAKNTAIRTAVATYEKTVLRHHRNLEEHHASRVHAFAQLSGLPLEELIFALYQPDMLMVLAGMTSERVSAQFLSGIPGCSTGVVRTGDDGAMTLLRNLDYPAADHWEKWSTAFYHEPSETHLQKFTSVGSLGIHLAGLTGINESGIGFSLHAHFSKKFSLKGVPIFFLGQEILETARSIDEAIFLCKRFRTIGSWAINLASDRENRAVTVELSDGKIHVREMTPDDPAHAHANGFQCDAFRKNELHFCGSFLEDVSSRKASLEENLTVPLDQKVSLQKALSALASHRDHQTGEIRIFGNTVSVVTTIQSMAFDLKKDLIHLSSRNETPTPIGPFVTIPTDWKKTNDLNLNAEPTLIEHGLSDHFLKALHHYHLAYCSWHVYSESATHALEHLLQATSVLSNDPHLWMQRGYFELILAKSPGHFKMARSCFENALVEKLSPHHTHVAKYFLSLCLDLENTDRKASLLILKELDSTAGLDPLLKKRVKNRIKKRFQIKGAKQIVPDLQFVEPLEYP